MNLESPLLIICSTTGVIFLITGFFRDKFPPKKINYLYGYRTSASKQSQEAWDFAQEFSSKEMTNWAWIEISAGIAGLFLHFNKNVELGVALTLITMSCVFLFLKTEKALKQRFK
jgi:uncharacterized membrane protein